MQTLNISVTKEQAKAVDRLIKEQGFANRSEFFRTLVRSVQRQSIPLDDFVFEEPPPRDAASVINDFRASGRYSEKFLKSLESGLRKSSYFSK